MKPHRSATTTYSSHSSSALARPLRVCRELREEGPVRPRARRCWPLPQRASRAGRGARRRRPAARCRSLAVRRRCRTVSRGRTRDRLAPGDSQSAASRPLPRRRDQGGGASGLRPKPGGPRPEAVGRPGRCGDHGWDAIMCVTITMHWHGWDAIMCVTITMHWHVARSEFQAAIESESLPSAS